MELGSQYLNEPAFLNFTLNHIVYDMFCTEHRDCG